MASETVIIVVGGDYLALEICREILKTAGHAVVMMWKHTDERTARLFAHETDRLAEEFGDAFTFLNEDPGEPFALQHAGLRSVEEAPHQNFCVVAVAQDDRMNLRVALSARDINDKARVTLRQFNPLLGHKIQEGLRYNCTAISPAAHAAATYAASSVDPACFYALPFPTLESMVARVAHRREQGIDPNSITDDGSALFGFSDRDAEKFGIAGMTVIEAEQALGARIVSINGIAPYLCHGDEEHPNTELIATSLAKTDRLVAFGPVRNLKNTGRRAQTRQDKAERRPLRVHWNDFLAGFRRSEPILRTALMTSVGLYVAFVVYFSIAMKWNVPATMYYVLTTMTTVGYGDVGPCNGCARGPQAFLDVASLFVAMGVMLAGLMTFAIFTASVTSGAERGRDPAYPRVTSDPSQGARDRLRRRERRVAGDRLLARTGRTRRRGGEKSRRAVDRAGARSEDRSADRRRDQRRNDRVLHARTRQESGRRHQQRYRQPRSGARERAREPASAAWRTSTSSCGSTTSRSASRSNGTSASSRSRRPN